ncbi:MAG: pilus assembly protein PilM [Planctomycetota bacterium]|nr:pilus assembly protein PilM [Planctomycetota bacterium]
MAHSTVWGLDIGNSAVKAVKMVTAGGEAVIVDFDIIDIYGGDEESERAVRVQAALRTLTTNHEFGNDPVYLSLPGDLCLFKEFQLPPGTSEAKVNDLVQYEAKQQIPFPLEQVEMGWERYDEPSGTGIGVELIAVRKTIIQEILQLTDQFNLNVQGITVAPMSLFNFVYYEFKPQGPALILDAGYKGTDFVVMHGRHIYSRTIPIAGREITRALENKFKVPFEKAEDLKKNIEQSKQADKILGVIEPTLRQLSAEIQRTIGFYKSRARGAKLAQCYLLGHTFRLPRMAENLAKQVREAPCSLVEGVNKIQLDRVINPGVFANEFPTMAVAIGLGLQGLGLSELRVNLLPQERKTEIAVGQKKIWGILSAAAILVALGMSWSHANREREQLAEAKKEAEAQAESVKEFEGKLNEALKSPEPLAGLEARVHRLSRIARDRGRMVQIFDRISGLKDAAGQPFFGPAKKAFLTNLYVSREPFTLGGEELKAIEDRFTNNRKDLVKNSQNFAGANGLYAQLAKAANVRDVDPELRADIPILVVLSGETHGMQDVLPELVQALKTAFPDEIKDVRQDLYKRDLKYREQPVEYDWDGRALPEKAPRSENQVPFTAFHLIFTWSPKDDPDIAPAVAKAPPAAAKTGAKTGASKPAPAKKTAAKH